MAAYNGVNGHTMTESPILNNVLKDEWEFDGLVVSDWHARTSRWRSRSLLKRSRLNRNGGSVLLAWLRAQAPNIVPLAGASRPASIRDSAALMDLADEDLEDLLTDRA